MTLRFDFDVSNLRLLGLMKSFAIHLIGDHSFVIDERLILFDTRKDPRCHIHFIDTKKDPKYHSHFTRMVSMHLVWVAT